MVAEIRQIRDRVADCHDLLAMNLGGVPDDPLREAMHDLADIREYAGELFDVIAIQLANNELAEIQALEADSELGFCGDDMGGTFGQTRRDMPAGGEAA